MTWAAGNPTVREEVKQDARTKGARHGAEENLNAFYQLSFLLTRDHEKAERCFVAGIEHLVRGNRAFNQWAHSWAKRIIVENAIRELKPRLRQSNFYSYPTTFPYIGQLSSSPRGHFELAAILALKDFERVVFVLSVLDQYSVEECAVLLGSSLSQIREARMRALQELVSSVDLVFPDNKTLEEAQE
jgi:DNA-directed RNA polymerase specialized sigma24 family protein